MGWWETISLLVKLLPMVVQIIQTIQRRQLTREATDALIADMTSSADILIARAIEARANVNTSQEAIDADPYNRD
jgi:hypothetical protein